MYETLTFYRIPRHFRAMYEVWELIKTFSRQTLYIIPSQEC